jgi:hypothetical protein
MPMHLNSLTPMRISGTPRSFLNLDSRRPTPIEAVVIGGDLDSPLPILRVGLVSMNMLSSLSVVARKPPGEEGTGSAALKRLCIPAFWIRRNRPRRLPLPMDNGAATSEARSPAPGSGAICAIGTDGHRGTNWFTDSVAGSGFDNQGSDPASPFRSQDPLHRPC